MIEETEARKALHSALNPGCSHWSPIVRQATAAAEMKGPTIADDELSRTQPACHSPSGNCCSEVLVRPCEGSIYDR